MSMGAPIGFHGTKEVCGVCWHLCVFPYSCVTNLERLLVVIGWCFTYTFQSI